MKNQNTQLKPAGLRINSTSAGLLIRLNTYRTAVLALLFAGATLLCTSAASAATITVINSFDSGPGSLRQALADANDGDTIDFDSSLNGQTITLASGQLVINKNLIITGPGANLLAINGNAASRVFYVGSGKTVTIDGLTLMNGHVPNFDTGGGIFINVHATLTITNSTISGNSAGAGGGIFNGAFGGATLTVTNSTISGNSAVSFAGGILSSGDFGSATLTVTNSTISGNSAGSFGGGILNTGYAGSATLTVTNSTISGNSAGSYGGGMYNDHATLTLNNSTLSGNWATSSSGGGIYNAMSATLKIGNSILNAGASSENIANFSGTITSLGYNLSNDSGGGFLTATGDQINTPPLLGPLQDNGGPTFTHALLVGSPAIDAGDPSFTPPPDYDQRGPGYPRVVDDRIDIGAFEVQHTLPCPQPQGYWKNNPGLWPVTSLELGSQTYSQAELLTILNTAVGTGRNADASLILANQLIAAKLNIANGSDPAPVSSTITDADSLLSGFSGHLPYHCRPSSASGQMMVNDANTLDSYNNGLLTPVCSP
jgi:hypothetical protein